MTTIWDNNKSKANELSYQDDMTRHREIIEDLEREYLTITYNNKIQNAIKSGDSNKIEVISDFGSTACKALYKCNLCNEPFHHFKQI